MISPETVMYAAGAVIGLLALPYIIWRMILFTPKFIWNIFKTCTVIVLGGGALFAGVKFAKFSHDNKDRVEEVGVERFWNETLPKAPWIVADENGKSIGYKNPFTGEHL